MPDQLEDSQDPGDTDQTKDLSGLADDVELRQVVDQEGDEVGQDGEQVDLCSKKSSHRSSFLVHSQSAQLLQMLVARWQARIYFSYHLIPQCRNSNPNHVSQESCTRLAPLKDALPTEPQRCVMVAIFDN